MLVKYESRWTGDPLDHSGYTESSGEWTSIYKKVVNESFLTGWVDISADIMTVCDDHCH